MKLERIKCKHFVHAQNIHQSPSYLVGCTGKRAVILDRAYELVQNIDGLDYVYEADFTQNEQEILLISTGNKFYVADMKTGNKQRVTVKAPYNCNLEGRGCWSHDDQSVLMLVGNSKNMRSALRIYQKDDLTKYEDLLAGQYQLLRIHRLGDGKTYLIIGRNDDGNRFIYYDGADFTHYPLADTEDQIVFNSDVDPQTGIVTIYSIEACYHYTPEGKLIKTIPHPGAKDEEVPLSIEFSPAVMEIPGITEALDQLFDELGVEDMNSAGSEDMVHKYGRSGCGRYLCMASESGFYVMDAETSEILAEVPEEYGVQNFEWVADDVVALATWGGVKLYRLTNA